MRALTCLFALIASLVAALPAPAGDVQFDLSARQAWEGTPIDLRIRVVDAKGDVADPILPRLDGCTLSVIPGRSRQSSMQWINGKSTNSSTEVITVRITPNRAGRFELPPVTMVVDGKTYSSGPLTFVAGKSEAGDRLIVDVVADDKQPYLGQPLDVVLRIWIRPFRSPEHNVRLSEADMWRLVDLERSEWGEFLPALREMAQQNRRPVGREELLGDTPYFVYEIPLRTTPAKAGIPDFSALRVAMEYPTRLSTQRDFFGSQNLVISGSQPITTVAAAEGIEVREPPTDGRPATWRGAVGSYRVRASATPTLVSVGDPITLHYAIDALTPDASLETLLPPPFSELPELEGAFRVPEDPIAGSVSGRTKEFTQTLRATRADVTEIPPVSFSWFDPRSGRYESASSAAIPLRVKPAEHIATDDLVSTPDAPARKARKALAGGLVASLPVDERLLRSESPMAPGSLLALGLLPPAACAAALLFARRRARHESDTGLARASGASRTARGALRAGDAEAAILGFIAAKCGRPEGTLTRPEAIELIRSNGGGEDLAQSVDAVLRASERARYGAPDPGGDISGQASSCLGALARLSWKRARSTGGAS